MIPLRLRTDITAFAAWIPAFAGMTGVESGNDGGWKGETDGVENGNYGVGKARLTG